MAQAVSRRPFTAEIRVRSQFIPGEICGTETGFSPSTSALPCQYHSTSAAYSSSSTRCSYQKDKRTKTGNIPESNAVSYVGNH